MADSNNAQIGAGVTLEYWNTVASPEAWATVGKVRSVAGVGVNKPEVDSTTLDSTAVERISGLPDGKEVTVVLTTRAATMTLIELWIAGTSAIDFKLDWPSPANVERYFSLAILDYEHGTIAPSGLLEITLKGRITGAAPTATPSHI